MNATTKAHWDAFQVASRALTKARLDAEASVAVVETAYTIARDVWIKAASAELALP